MIGDSPQPGETPRSEEDPWSFGDPDTSWWRGETERSEADAAANRGRHPRRRVPQGQTIPGGTGTLLPPAPPERERTGEAAEGHVAGTRDATEQLAPDQLGSDQLGSDQARPAGPLVVPPAPENIQFLPAEAAPTAEPTTAGPTTTGPTTAGPTTAGPTAAEPTAAGPTAAEPTATESTAAELTAAGPTAAAQTADMPVAPRVIATPLVERDHDKPDPHRYDPLNPGAGHTAKVTAETVAADHQGRTQEAPEPDVMILPEPGLRSRPTVPLERGSVPGQTGRPRPSDLDLPPLSDLNLPRHGSALTRPTEPLPPLTGQPHTDFRLEKLENSPFWRDHPEDTLEVPQSQPARSTIRTHRSKPKRGGLDRKPLSAHIALIAVALVAAFFGWVSAEPFWLAVGHGDHGYATTAHCSGSGVTQRCTGTFSAGDGRFTVSQIALLGVTPEGRAAGSVAKARMVSPSSRQAYVGDTGTLLHLRWILGFALVLVCGYAVAGVSGARRLETARARRAAVLLSMVGPLALLAGFLIAAF